MPVKINVVDNVPSFLRPSFLLAINVATRKRIDLALHLRCKSFRRRWRPSPGGLELKVPKNAPGAKIC